MGQSAGIAGEVEDVAAIRAWCDKVQHWSRSGTERVELEGSLAKDWNRLEQRIRTLAAEGDAACNNALGVALTVEPGGSDHPVPAISFWTKAAEKGSASAMVNLGRAYSLGIGLEKDPANAVKWFRQAAELGDASAMGNLSWCYLSGFGVPQSSEDAAHWARKGAEAGNPNAMTNLAVLYRDGNGVPKSYEEALKWFVRAADRGVPSAMQEAGSFYANGWGTPVSGEDAMKWLLKGAELGHAGCMNEIGMIHENGQGVPQSMDEALKWYLRAAAAGSPSAHYNIGQIYYDGIGTERSLKAASMWFGKAVDLGDYRSMWMLGDMYRTGTGVPLDPNKGVALIRRAAERGHPKAMCTLATCCAMGLGTAQSTEEAKLWAQKAIAAGHDHLRGELEAMLKTADMDPLAIAKEATRLYNEKGQKVALEYLDKNAMAKESLLFRNFWAAIWKEAQIRGGREHISWRADLYRWLYETYFGKLDPKDLSPADVALLHEVVDATREAGYIGLCRHYAVLHRQAAAAQLGIPIDVAALVDHEPFDVAFPEIRTREFPTTIPITKTDVSYVDYIPMQAVSNLSWQAWMEGDWKTSAEAAAWRYHWGDWSVRNREMIQPTGNDHTQARHGRVEGLVGVIRVFDLLGFYDLSSKYCRQLFEIDENAHAFGGLNGLAARRYGVIANLARGNATEEHLRILEANIKQERENYDQIEGAWTIHAGTKAEVLFALGRADEAWVELKSLLDGSGGDEISLPKAEILITWIHHALAFGRLEGVESRLQQAVEICRRKGYKVHEPRLYSLYARYLYLSGDIGEAIRMQIEAIRLFEALDLYTRVPIEYRTLAQYYLLSGQPETARGILSQARALVKNGRVYPEWIVKAAEQPLDAPTALNRPNGSESHPDSETSLPQPKNQQLVILQPSGVSTAPLAGLQARTSFVLINSSPRSHQGVISVNGPGAQFVTDAQQIICTLTPGTPVRTVSHSVFLASNQRRWVEFATATTPTSEGQVRISYLEQNREKAASTWKFMPSDAGRTVAVVEAVLMEDNPFYLIPATHVIQATGLGRRTVNLRIKASVPTRIEIYLPDGKPLLIDADGNGSLAEQGDVLFQDRDNDGFGDLIMEAGVTDLPLSLYYKPLGPSEEVKIDLETKDGDRWQFDSQDVVRSPRK